MKEHLRKAAVASFRFAFGRGPARAAVASFALAILIGAALLTLPFSSRAMSWTSPIDSLFTATSAVCVTGLLVKSTPNHWSLFGQLVILTLIQVGGLGIMTLGAFLATILQRRLSMRFEAVMGDIVEATPAEGVWTLIRFICVFTLVAEAIGAVVLFFGWRGHFGGFWPCFYHSVFHSISAFCNAGFSLNDSSLIEFAGSFWVSMTISALIIAGGIGFLVVRELVAYARWHTLTRRGKRPRLSTHTRLVLLVTGVLLLVGFVGVFVLESHGSMFGEPLETRLLAAIFQSTTPRTAGFNTIPMNPEALAPSTILLIMVLMYIGGSPGSTAGGIKTTTLGIMIASIVATLKGRSKAQMFNHSVPAETVHRVASIILLSVAALTGGIFLLLITESAGFVEIVFDAISAFGTVGLSLGFTGPTPQASASGRLIITALMFIGRLGPITLVLSVAHLKEREVYGYPEDQVMVG